MNLETKQTGPKYVFGLEFAKLILDILDFADVVLLKVGL